MVYLQSDEASQADEESVPARARDISAGGFAALLLVATVDVALLFLIPTLSKTYLRFPYGFIASVVAIPALYCLYGQRKRRGMRTGATTVAIALVLAVTPGILEFTLTQPRQNLSLRVNDKEESTPTPLTAIVVTDERDTVAHWSEPDSTGLCVVRQVAVGSIAYVLTFHGDCSTHEFSASENIVNFEPNDVVIKDIIHSGDITGIRTFPHLMFDANLSMLDEVAKSEVYRIATFMKNNPGLVLFLMAHASVDGGSKGNYKLSVRRGEETKDALVECGIDPERVSIVAFGEERPFVFGKGVKVHSQNRRVCAMALPKSEKYSRVTIGAKDHANASMVVARGWPRQLLSVEGRKVILRGIRREGLLSLRYMVKIGTEPAQQY